MEAKKRYTVFVSPSVWRRFMLEVGRKWGCMYGAKSLEIEFALNKAIAELPNSGKEKSKAQSHAHIEVKNQKNATALTFEKGKREAEELWSQLLFYLADHCDESIDRVSEGKMMEIFPFDGRTVERKINLLKRFGYLKLVKAPNGKTSFYLLRSEDDEGPKENRAQVAAVATSKEANITLQTNVSRFTT